MTPRIFVSETPERLLDLASSRQDLELSKESSKHLAQVLRLTAGTEIILCSRSGAISYRAIISSISSKGLVTLRLLSPQEQTDESEQGLRNNRIHTLAFATLKGAHNELVFEKATELGVRRFILFQGDRSVAKLSETKNPQKKTRYQKIVEQACMQCGRSELPDIILSKNLEETLSLSVDNDRLLHGSLEEDARELRELSPAFTSGFFITGPEGHFSPDELILLNEATSFPVSLGCLILRAETASLTALASATALWGLTE